MMIEFIVLACSYKHGGRCVAGIDLSNKKMIRLISSDKNTNYAIPKDECKINDIYIMPLDVIEVEIKEKAPSLGAQTENYYITFPLIKKYVRKASIKELTKYLFKSDVSPYPFDSKAEFLNTGAYHHRKYSLCLIRAYALKINNIVNSEGNCKTKISFDIYKYNGDKVRLENYAVTDPHYTIYEFNNPANKTFVGKAYLLISLGQDDQSDSYYKYVSGIIDVANN